MTTSLMNRKRGLNRFSKLSDDGDLLKSKKKGAIRKKPAAKEKKNTR